MRPTVIWTVGQEMVSLVAEEHRASDMAPTCICRANSDRSSVALSCCSSGFEGLKTL